MKSLRIADYDVIYKEGKKSSPAIVILHGYGADYTDLAPLGQFMDEENHFNWYFINGPIDVQFAGRAWYELDVMRLQIAAGNGDYAQYIENTKQVGMIDAAKKVLPVLESIKDQHKKVYLGGFSQGSMVSCEMAFSRPELFSKLFVMSGTFVGKDHWDELISDKKVDFEIFQDHGEMDTVLPVTSARKLNEYFKGQSYKTEYHEFSGGHEIPPRILSKLKDFLER